MESEKENWHLDKRVPLALLGFLLVQFVAVIMYVGGVSSRSSENERRILVLETQRVAERMASVEIQLIDTKALMLRIDNKLDKMGERGQR